MITLGDELAAALPELRRLAESLMLDTARVDTITTTTTDPLTGATVPTYATAYAGRCKVQTGTTQESNPVAGGATFTVQRAEIHVPVGSFAPAVDQVITITAAALDPLLVGRVFRVVSLLHKTASTAYRLGVEEVVS